MSNPIAGGRVLQWALVSPALLWTLLFFVLPFIAMGLVSLTAMEGGFTLDNSIGNVNLTGGALIGGVLSTLPGHSARLIATATQGTLDGVVMNTPIDLYTNNAKITVLNNLTLAAGQTLQVGSPSGSTSGRPRRAARACRARRRS